LEGILNKEIAWKYVGAVLAIAGVIACASFTSSEADLKRGYCSKECGRSQGCSTCSKKHKACYPNKKACEAGSWDTH
jgi:hypothetical protein